MEKPPRTIFTEGSIEVLAEALTILKNTQYLIETDGPWRDKQPTKDNIRQYCFALVDEVTEYAKELGWKDWKQPKRADPLRVADEFADILAFLGVVLDYGLKLTTLSELEMAVQYRIKSDVNLRRLAGEVEGYGALSIQRPPEADYPARLLTEKVARKRAMMAGVYYAIVIDGITRTYFLASKPKEGSYELRQPGTGEVLILHESDDNWEVA